MFKMGTVDWRELLALPTEWRSVISRPAVLATGITLGATSVMALWYWYKNRHLPPGPTKWPLIGSVSGVSSTNYDRDIFRLSQVYGDVFSFQYGPTLVIVLASHSAIKEALVQEGDTFACRPHGNRKLIMVMDIKDDMFGTPYQTEGWNQNKSFLLSTLRGAGFGTTKTAEEKILEQFQVITLLLEENVKNSTPISLKEILPKVTTNILFQILFNKSFEYDDPELAKVMHTIEEFLGSFADGAKFDKVPRCLIGIFFRKQIQLIHQRTQNLRELVLKEVRFHKKTIDPEHSRDFVDDYLIKKGGEHSIERITENTMVFIPDGCDTMARILEVVLLYLTYHQDVQQKAVDEITKITDRNRLVTWADRSQLPYCEAVIMEAIRHATPISVLPPHAVSREVYFRGYRIPTHAHITASLYAAHNDLANYSDPDQFRPERFLDHGSLVKSDIWIPFGMGRRKCPGEQIARIETFLLTTNLLSQFNFSFADGEHVSLELGGNAVIRSANPFKVILSQRQ